LRMKEKASRSTERKRKYLHGCVAGIPFEGGRVYKISTYFSSIL
jgi:hypothetical protein